MTWEEKEGQANELLICNLEGKSFTVDVSLEGDGSNFKDGTYKLEYGNGDKEDGIKKADFPRRVKYDKAGEYSLVFSAETLDGKRVSTTYKVKAVKRPAIKLEPENRDVKCVGSEITYLVNVYDENPAGTKYKLDFNDGTILNLTNEELKNFSGRLTHTFEYSSCDEHHAGPSKEYFDVWLTVSNECGSDYEMNMHYEEKMVEKIVASFTFSEFDGENCTFVPVQLQNTTYEGLGINCLPTKVEYEWDFGNGKKSYQEHPSVTYEEANENGYKIRLIATNGFECARDTAEVSVRVLASVKAMIEPEKDTVCAGELLLIRNRETMGGAWLITSLDAGYAPPEYDTRTGHMQVRFEHYGRYKVTYMVGNHCSYDETDTIITVLQDPDLIRYDVPEKTCLSDTWNMADFLSVSWNGNAEGAKWTITRRGGTNNADVEWLNGTDAQSAYPVFRFKQAGVYQVALQLPDIGCGGTKLTDTKEITVYDPAVTVKIDTTPLNICENGTVSFTNSSIGDNLQYEWSVQPMTRVEFINNTDMKSASPIIKFGRYGNYEVKLRMSAPGGCGAVDTVFQVHVRKDPSILFLELPEAVCPGEDYLFYPGSSAGFQFYNNEAWVKWSIQPKDGWQFVTGDENTPYPAILFEKPGEYRFTVELNSAGCPEQGSEKLRTGSLRVRNSAMSMTGSAIDSLVCEGESLQFSLNAEAAEGGMQYAWTVSPLDGSTEYAYGNNHSVAVIAFNHWGTYEVRGAASSYCGILDTTFRVVVQKDPKVELQENVSLCPGEHDMKGFVTYQWFNNVPEVQWTIERTSGGNKDEGFTIDDASAEYPKINFQWSGDYRVNVVLTSHTQGCDEDSLKDTRTFHVYDSVISGDITMVGTGEICEGDAVSFMNTTNVEGGLQWEWRVEGAEDGYAFQDGGKTSTERLPEITFSKYGDYRVYVKAIGLCSVKEFPAFPVTVSGIPEVTVADVSGVCEPFDFEGRNLINIDSHNDAIRWAQWTITENPEVVCDGYEYLGTSADTLLYPDIRFRSGDYAVHVSYWNRCHVPGEVAFRIQVDKYIPITAIGNDSICSQSPEVRLLTAEPGNGVWSLKNPDLPNAGEILFRDGENYYFNPKFGAYDEQDVPLVYKLYNASCVASAEVNMHVWALPYVEAGDIRQMCLNHEPRLLIGKDSVAGSVWQSNRGEWLLDGQVLPEHHFRAEQVGNFQILYRYEDSHRCVNIDSTVMRVHALPDTAFVSQPQYCRGVPAEFTVEKGAESLWYIWEYYAGARQDTLPGNGQYVYEQAGRYEVRLIAKSTKGCQDTSSVHVIEVVDDAPQADFTLSTHEQCGPEVAVQIGVKEENYADHNLRFEWILGNGTTSESLLPALPQIFYSTAEDTVYRVKFRVYNVCNETEKTDSLRIGSLPKADFLLANGGRNCSPLSLQVLNTSTGTRNQYLWYMGDGSEPLSVFEPRDYVYETDSERKEFHLSLVAVNQCGKDSVMQPLTVLAQSIRAFFDKPKDEICVGEQLCFTNHTRDTARDITYKYWDFGDGVRDTSWNACHVYRDSGRYKVLLYVDNGCSSDTTSKFLNVMGNPKLELLLEESRCDRDTFHFAFETDLPLQWVQWTLGDDSTVFAPSFSYVYREPGSYPVTLEVVGDNRAACRSSEQLVLTVHPRPALHVVPLDTLVCSPYLYEPRIEGVVDKIMWDYGDGTPETSAEEHWYVNETDTLAGYEILLHAVSDQGCPEDYPGYIRVAHLPHAEIEKRVTNGRPQKVELVNLSPEGYVDYIWLLPGDKLVHTTGNQYFEFMENGVHLFSLITENQYGCRDTATVEHEVMLKGLYFPNTFIPHSTNARINRFNGIGMGLVRYKLEIFDRYGNKLWETVELEDGKPVGGWDGCNRKGERLPQGVYIWRAEAIFGNDEVWTGKNNDSGVPETTQGTVLLLRE